MLPAEKWAPGLMVQDQGGDKKIYILTRGVRVGGRDLWRYRHPGGILVACLAGIGFENWRAIPVSYDDIGRRPVVGEPERMVRIAGTGEITRARIGDIYEWRAGEHGWAPYWANGTKNEWGTFVPELFAPLAQTEEPVPATEKGNYQEPANTQKREAMQPDSSSGTTPAPSVCARVAAARVEVWKDAETVSGMDLVGGGKMQTIFAFTDKWRPRIAEFEPCGDCPTCLELAVRLEAKAKILSEDFSCSHGVLVGGWCYRCPAGRARK